MKTRYFALVLILLTSVFISNSSFAQQLDNSISNDTLQTNTGDLNVNSIDDASSIDNTIADGQQTLQTMEDVTLNTDYDNTSSDDSNTTSDEYSGQTSCDSVATTCVSDRDMGVVVCTSGTGNTTVGEFEFSVNDILIDSNELKFYFVTTSNDVYTLDTSTNEATKLVSADEVSGNIKRLSFSESNLYILTDDNIIYKLPAESTLETFTTLDKKIIDIAAILTVNVATTDTVTVYAVDEDGVIVALEDNGSSKVATKEVATVTAAQPSGLAIHVSSGVNYYVSDAEGSKIIVTDGSTSTDVNFNSNPNDLFLNVDESILAVATNNIEEYSLDSDGLIDSAATSYEYSLEKISTPTRVAYGQLCSFTYDLAVPSSDDVDEDNTDEDDTDEDDTDEETPAVTCSADNYLELNSDSSGCGCMAGYDVDYDDDGALVCVALVDDGLGYYLDPEPEVDDPDDGNDDSGIDINPNSLAFEGYLSGGGIGCSLNAHNNIFINQITTVKVMLLFMLLSCALFGFLRRRANQPS